MTERNENVPNSTPVFYVTHGGKLHAENAEIEGRIVAKEGGSIAGWSIGTNFLCSFIANNVGAGLSGDSQDWKNVAIWAGSGPNERDAAPFRVNYYGELFATRGSIAGWNINSNILQSPGENVTLHSNGDYAITVKTVTSKFDETISDIRIIVKIFIDLDESGQEYTIDSSVIIGKGTNKQTGQLYLIYKHDSFIKHYYYNGRVEYNKGTYDSWQWIEGGRSRAILYTNIITTNSTDETYPFVLYKSGSLVATNANISGNIIASSGSIAGWDISPGSLWSGSSNTYVSLNSSSDNDYAFWAGAENPENAMCSISKQGAIIAKDIQVEGGSIRDWIVGNFDIFQIYGSTNPYVRVGSDESPNSSEITKIEGLGNYKLPPSGSSNGILLTTNKLIGYFRNGNDRIDYVFPWSDLAKLWSRELGIKYGQVTVDTSKSNNWIFSDLFDSNGVAYYIFATPATDMSTADLFITTRWSSNGYYQVGVKRNSANSTVVNYMAVPVVWSVWS